jgi:predicted ABC-type transport system involved in lysophospholipase L1 biosynthesis ATPase subunit
MFDQALHTFGDAHVTDLRHTQIGLVFQSFRLSPTLIALENAALPLLIVGDRPLRRGRRVALHDE